MNSLFLKTCAPVVLVALMGCDVSVGRARDDYEDDYDRRADDGLPPPPPDATLPVAGGEAGLSVEWTIDGATDPRACDDFDVARAYVTIEDDGGLVDEADVDCGAFGYDSPPVPPGIYWATVELRDAAGRALTDAAESDETDVRPGGSSYLSVDFSESSFL